MAAQPPSEKDQVVLETAAQQSILQQAEAAIAGQANSASPTEAQEAQWQETNLLTPDAADDELPPPAYGDTYGEIRNEKDGLGASARVTDDGRVNIRIDQRNLRLSQILTPALRHQVQSVKESLPPPPPYIPASLGGKDKGLPPPRLNVVMQVVGSRGDVQPFVALGKVLKDTYGHRVRLATHPNFKDFVQENSLEFFSIGGDPSRLMASMVTNPSLLPSFRSLRNGDVSQRRRDVAEYIQGCWRSCYKAGDGMGLRAADPGSEPEAIPFVADCIIANPPSFAHIHCAEKLGIPLHIMFTMPWSPTQAFPHPLANIQSSNTDPQLTNYVSYAMIEVLTWQGLGDIINRFRAKCLNLDPVSVVWAPGMLQRLKVPHTYCWSPALIPKPKDWGPPISVAGFYFLDLASNYTPPPDLQSFLDAGPPPVYIGFGSIVLDDPNAMTELIFEAVRKTGQRVLLSKGWGGMGANELRIPDGVFMLGNVPHDWLFKQVSCIVHHGGAGTTAAGIAAGRPTLIVPFFGDQPFWGAMVARAGAGPPPIPHKKLTADNLADAIRFCLKPESLERARELANKIVAERGSDMGALSFHQYLEVDRLRCILAPSRPAVWRIKRTQVRLSAFAACTLANANLLDFHDLKLFRLQEYETDKGPWDPVSGGFVACAAAFSNMAMGIADIPSETWKAMQLPFKRVREESQGSVPTIPGKRETSSMAERSTAPTSPGQSQTGLSNPSSPTSNVSSSSMSDELQQSRLNSKLYNASRSRVRNGNESGFDKEPDMLRTPAPHTSKGLGRFVKGFFEIPMEISVGLTKGFHNFPKMWGDDTVRPQEQVVDFKSGVKAAGKEFGFGWYDGVTGLATQPWRGAQKEGVTGFVKGFGRGIGGFATKPFAGFAGILGHTIKGVHKEVQKLFSGNVQNYIVASRVAQGYEEWLQSSEAEKQDVIARWTLVQKYLKNKGAPDEMVRDVLDAQQKISMEDGGSLRSYGHTASSARSTNSTAASTQDADSDLLAHGGSESYLRRACTPPVVGTLGETELDETMQPPVEETSHEDAEGDANVDRAIQDIMSQVHREREAAASLQGDQETLRQAMAASEAEAQRHAREALEYEEQLRRAMAHSVLEQRQKNIDSEWDSDIDLYHENDEEFKRASKRSGKRPENAVAVAVSSPPGVQQSPAYDPGHLAGTTQSEFEAQQQGQQGEKTTQERREEEIVLEYIKKQSLLEQHHQRKGKGRATNTDDEDDEDLQEALKLSMQGHEHEPEYPFGGPSRT
ncbi:putative glucosyl/glucuronosyl transferase [Xylariales sp. PMI_506]|nr:putative glucosyl/glucuronosyl transferase [Xylariales sp. PMI_506]